MNSREVVIHIVKRNRVAQVIKLLAETVGQARESAHAHSHRKVLAFDVASRDMLRVGVAGDCFWLTANALAGAVASVVWWVAVELNQHRIINLASECAFNRL